LKPWKVAGGVRERRSMPRRRGEDGEDGRERVRSVAVGIEGAMETSLVLK
jgi:hypothetical protein